MPQSAPIQFDPSIDTPTTAPRFTMIAGRVHFGLFPDVAGIVFEGVASRKPDADATACTLWIQPESYVKTADALEAMAAQLREQAAR